MTHGEGVQVLTYEVGDERLDNGYLLIFRYLVHLLARFQARNHIDSCSPNYVLRRFAIGEFSYYALRVEQEGFQSARNVFEPAFLRMSEIARRFMLTEILLKEPDSPRSDELTRFNKLHGRVQAQLLYFYLALRLKVGSDDCIFIVPPSLYHV